MDDLQIDRIRAGLQGTSYEVEVVDSVASTQRVLASASYGPNSVVIARQQTAGRGRNGRVWTSGAEGALTFSVRLAGLDEPSKCGLAASLAVSRAMEPVVSTVKWPNDVLVGDRKVCGILGELLHGGDVVCGIGINVSTHPEDVNATDLKSEGLHVRRDDLVVAVLLELYRLINTDFMDAYRKRCSTIGRTVSVETASGPLTGQADVRDDGMLLVNGQPVAAGDVIHVR